MLFTKILGLVEPPSTLGESDYMNYENKTELKSNSRLISADICPVIWDDQIFSFEVVTSSGKPSVSKLNQLSIDGKIVFRLFLARLDQFDNYFPK